MYQYIPALSPDIYFFILIKFSNFNLNNDFTLFVKVVTFNLRQFLGCGLYVVQFGKILPSVLIDRIKKTVEN